MDTISGSVLLGSVVAGIRGYFLKVSSSGISGGRGKGILSHDMYFWGQWWPGAGDNVSRSVILVSVVFGGQGILSQGMYFWGLWNLCTALQSIWDNQF